MTGFSHAHQTDDKTAGPDLISAAKLMARAENTKSTNREESPDGQIHRGMEGKKSEENLSGEHVTWWGGRRCLRFEAHRGQKRARRDPSHGANRGLYSEEKAEKQYCACIRSCTKKNQGLECQEEPLKRKRTNKKGK